MTIGIDTNVELAKEAKRAHGKVRRPAKSRVKRVLAVTNHSAEIVPLDADRRHHMIAEAAYFMAQQRGFEAGHEMQDWLAAEHEIDARLCGEPLVGGALP